MGFLGRADAGQERAGTVDHRRRQGGAARRRPHRAPLSGSAGPLAADHPGSGGGGRELRPAGDLHSGLRAGPRSGAGPALAEAGGPAAPAQAALGQRAVPVWFASRRAGLVPCRRAAAATTTTEGAASARQSSPRGETLDHRDAENGST